MLCWWCFVVSLPLGTVEIDLPLYPLPNRVGLGMTSTPRSRSLGAGNIVDEKSAVEKEFLPETFDRLSTKDRKSDGGVEEDGHGGVERGVQEMEKEEVEVEHPNGGYGWVCVGCIFMVNA